MLRFNPRLLAAVGLLPLVLGTGVAHAPTADAHPFPSIAKGARTQPVNARSEADSTADIPGVTYPRAAPPDLTARNVHPDAKAAAEAVIQQPDKVPAAGELSSTAKPELETKARAVTLKLDVDLAEQRLSISEDGDTKYVWPISSGRAGYATRTGTFRPQWASRMWYSRQYDMAPMPHAVFFNRGIAFHATAATHLLGLPASHGCVRLSPENARKLYAMIHRHGFQSTEINVFGSPKVANQGTRKSKAGNERRPRAPENASNSPFGTWAFF